MLITAVYILAFLILVGLAFWVLPQLGLPDPILKVLRIVAVVVVVVIAVVWMVQWASGGGSLPMFPHDR
jgi:hypothetical protein